MIPIEEQINALASKKVMLTIHVCLETNFQTLEYEESRMVWYKWVYREDALSGGYLNEKENYAASCQEYCSNGAILIFLCLSK